MEFLRERVYTSLNADELRAGDKVIVANSLYYLKKQVLEDDVTDEIVSITTDTDDKRFRVDRSGAFALAYLVERKENCTNCGNQYQYRVCDFPHHDGVCDRCEFYEPKTEQKDEPTYKWVNYRPFKDTDELIKVWCEKGSKWQKRELTMPLIWVRRKDCNCKGQLITKFSDPSWVIMSTEGYNMTDLFVHFTFLDGSPCGVEE